MKILAAADLHGDKIKTEKLAEKARKENVDLVILCGDLTYAEADLTGIIGPFKKINKKTIIIPGNHETFATAEFLAKQYAPGVYNLHGRSIMFYNEIGFFGCGSANVGLFELPEKEVEDLLTKAHKPIKDARVKIIVAHAPPYNTKLDALWAHVGSKGLRKVIETIKPDVVVCGHVHETFGLHDKIGKTEIINVGPNGVVIDIPKKKS